MTSNIQGQPPPGGTTGPGGPGGAGGQPPMDLAEMLVKLQETLGKTTPTQTSDGKAIDSLSDKELHAEFQKLVKEMIALPLPGDPKAPEDASGLANPWLKPNAIVFLISIRMEMIQAMMGQKMAEGLIGAENLHTLMELTQAKGEAIKDAGEMEAAQHFARAASSFATAAISAASAGLSFGSRGMAKAKAKSHIKTESAKLQNNPKATDPNGPPGNINNYQKAQADLKAAKNDIAMKQNNPKQYQKNLAKAEGKVLDTRPGNAQIDAWKAANPPGAAGGAGASGGGGGPKAAIRTDLNKVKVANDKQLTKMQDPKYLEKRTDQYAYEMQQQFQMVNQTLSSVSSSVEAALSGYFTLEKTKAEALKSQIEGAEQILRTEMDSQKSAVQEANEAIGEIVRALMQEIRAYSDTFKFAK